MKTILFVHIIIVAAVGPGKASAARLPIDVIEGRPIVSGVFLDGHGPFRFLVDTGTQTNQLDVSIAGKLGFHASSRKELVTATGAAWVPAGRIAEVVLGSAHAAGQEFLVTNLKSVRVSGAIQGVLGQEFLSQFDYLLDLNGRTLSFDPPVLPGIRIPTERIDRRPTLQTSAGRLVLDSGSDAVILFHAAGSGPEGGTIRTASGFAAYRSMPRVRLRIAGCEYRVARVVAVNQPDLTEDGLLPLSLFSSVYVSNSANYVVIGESTTHASCH